MFLANSEEMQWCFIVVFICILVIINDVFIDRFYIFFWTSIYSYLLQIFKLRYFVFLLPSCACHLSHILHTSLLFKYVTKFFTHSESCFSLFKWSPLRHKGFKLIILSNLSVYHFFAFVFDPKYILWHFSSHDLNKVPTLHVTIN